MAGLSFQHVFHGLSENAEGAILFDIYTKLLDHLNISRGQAHNMILTKRWMLVIPRSKGRVEYMFANAAGMVGLIWCAYEPQYDLWLRYGPMRALREMGVPIEKAEL
jgi:ATP adenylyltransferase